MKKNIIMILTDQMHKYALGLYGDHIITPHLDKLAGEGVVFTNAYSNNPVCGPFRGNLFTGLLTCNNGVEQNGNPLPDIECLARTFNRNGYETSFVGKWHLGGNGNKPISEELRGGFKHFIGYQCYNGFYNNVYFYDEQNKEHRFNKHREDVTTDIGIERLELLAKEDKPFLHVIFYQAPHYPEQPADEFYELYKDKEIPYSPNYIEIDPYTPTYDPYSPRPFENCPDYVRYGNNMQEYKRMYNAMVTQIDFGVGRILRKVQALGISEETLILFSSDHGDMQGSHGFKNKCLPYEESCGIPLMIKTPDCNGGSKVEIPVSGIDFYPTCLAFAGISASRELDGRSLLPFLKKENTVKEDMFRPVFAENYLGDFKWAMIRDREYKLVVEKESCKPCLLFNIKEDPYELLNLVDNHEYQEIRNNLLISLQNKLF